MADLYWPSSLVPAQSRFEIIDGAGRFSSTFTGRVRTVSRPGATRIRATLDVMNLKDERRAALQSFVAGQLGAVNRVWLKDHSYTRRGSFPATELLANNTFESGTTGWTAQNCTFTVADRIARVAGAAPSATLPAIYQGSLACVQYAPYAMRSVVRRGRGFAAATIGVYTSSSITATDYESDGGYREASLVAMNSTISGYPAVVNDTDNYLAGDYIDCPWGSLARCALADGGGNLLTYSADFTNAAWSNFGTTDAADAVAAPDGTTTADSLIEDTATSNHGTQQTITVSSAVADYVGAISVLAAGRTWVRVLLVENTATTTAYVNVNLSTGAVGASAVGANWGNVRAFVVSQGGGWYRIFIVARKTNAATQIRLRVEAATADNSVNYLGNGAVCLYVWGASLTQSSVPVRYVSTTGTASSAATQTGVVLYLKGLPASTSGLLLPGDQVQVGNELKFVTASLNSDAAGLGYLQLAPEIREPVANDAAVIVHEPMGLFMLEQQENGWDSTPGVFSAASVQLIEATP